MKKKIRSFLNSLVYRYTVRFNARVKNQRLLPSSIPVIIINYNQLDNLVKLVDFLLVREIRNIVIIDNKSDFPPLLDYYKKISSQVSVELMNENYGHMVFFKNDYLQSKYGKGYYILTDADILPNPKLPLDFINKMIAQMDKYHRKIVKVGFALDLETIPVSYPFKDKVIKWENKFWEHELEQDVYLAIVDTTFALYKPCFPSKYRTKHIEFYDAIRLAGDFTCKHMGWYLDPNELTEEQQHYMKTSSSSNSWKFDERGTLTSNHDY